MSRVGRGWRGGVEGRVDGRGGWCDDYRAMVWCGSAGGGDMVRGLRMSVRYI